MPKPVPRSGSYKTAAMPHQLSGPRPADPLPSVAEAWTDVLSAVVAEAAAFHRSLPGRPAGTRHQLSALTMAKEGKGALHGFREAVARFDPLIVASPSSRYLGYVTGGATPAALAGDWLAAVYDQNPQGTGAFGDASAQIELEACGLLRETLGLPHDFNGGFVTGATLSNFTCLAVARQWAGAQQQLDVGAQGTALLRVRILSAVPHSSATKALSMLGLGRGSVQSIATLPDREAMDVRDLERRLAGDPEIPTIIVASAATVNTADFDDLAAIQRLRDRYRFWLHVDAAFGGFAALLPADADPCPEDYPGGRLRGWEGADSITVDNHKWLNVPYDSGTWFIRAEHDDLQHATFRNGSAPYLGAEPGTFNFLNRGPENSRRLRALPVWCTLRAYGISGYRDIVARCVRSAVALGAWVADHPCLALLAPVRLNVVAFTITGADRQTLQRYLQLLSDRGRFFLTPTELHGRAGMRAAFVNWQTEPEDVTALTDELTACLELLDARAPAPRRPKH